MSWKVLAVAVAMGAASAAPPAQSVQLRRTEVVRALDLYAAGRADEALALVSRASRDRIRDWRQVLVSYGHAWIHNGPANLSPRIFAAAAFALEMEAVRAERGEWGRTSMVDCGGQCVIEWGCAILRARGVSDDHERAWLLASMALVGGVLTLLFGAWHIVRRQREKLAIPYGVAIAIAGLWTLSTSYLPATAPIGGLG